MVKYLSFSAFLLLCIWLKAEALPQNQFLLNEENPPKILENQTLIRRVPPIPGTGQVILEFEHRIDFPKLGGWTPCMEIEVNGQILTAMATRQYKRLLNSDLETPGHMDHGTYRRNKSNMWYNLYSPDFEAAKSRFYPFNPEAYRIRLDITDTVYATRENTIGIRFGGYGLQEYYDTIGIKDRKPGIVLRNLSVKQLATPSPLQRREEAPKATFITMKAPQATQFSAIIQENGAIHVVCNGVSFPVDSSFSAPNGKRFALGNSPADPWTSLKSAHHSLTAENSFFKLIRQIEIKTNRIDVRDTFQSKMQDLAGTRIAYTVNAQSCNPIFLGGDKSPNITENAGGRNPTVFLASTTAEAGLGLVAVDDVFRVQNRQFYHNGTAGISSDTFALLPGKSQTVEWSIYPVNSQDYFDFINQVRQDWKVNFTIKDNLHFSMFDYLTVDQGTTQHFIEQLGTTAQTFCVLFWKNIGQGHTIRDKTVHGFGLMLDELRSGTEPGRTVKVEPMREAVRRALATCKERNPNIKRLMYVHNQYCNEPNDLEKYGESKLIDLKGRTLTGGGGNYYNIFVPTLENEFGKQYFKFIQFLFDDMGLDGIYHDEFTSSNRPLSSTMWDGVSVELDDHGNFKRKIGFTPLLMLPLNLKVMDYVINQRGKTFIGNFSPETRSELQFQVPRFEEVIYPSWIYYTHLYTPIQLGGGTAGFRGTSADVMREVREALSNGALYYPPYMQKTPYKTICAYMFPFTPVEIHSGYLVGKERILTIHSGEFGIPGENRSYQAIVFAKDGSPIPNYPFENVTTVDGIKCRISLQDGQCAVIILNP